MALETLKGTKEIGGFKVIVMDELRKQYPEKFNESGAMDLIEIAGTMIEKLNEKFPCDENKLALFNLASAAAWLDQIKKDRENRGVEGQVKA